MKTNTNTPTPVEYVATCGHIGHFSTQSELNDYVASGPVDDRCPWCRSQPE